MGTGIGLFARMDLNMFLQGLAMRELLSTDRTGVGLLCCINYGVCYRFRTDTLTVRLLVAQLLPSFLPPQQCFRFLQYSASTLHTAPSIELLITSSREQILSELESGQAWSPGERLR